MSTFIGSASALRSAQIVSTSAPRSIDPDMDTICNRILLLASTGGIFVGDKDVTTASGMPIPTGAAATPLALWVKDANKVWVVGAGTVYIIYEEPSTRE